SSSTRWAPTTESRSGLRYPDIVHRRLDEARGSGVGGVDRDPDRLVRRRGGEVEGGRGPGGVAVDGRAGHVEQRRGDAAGQPHAEEVVRGGVGAVREVVAQRELVAARRGQRDLRRG